MNEKIVAQLPLPAILRIIGKLVRYAKGGIDKDEAADLAEELLLLVAHLVEARK